MGALNTMVPSELTRRVGMGELLVLLGAGNWDPMVSLTYKEYNPLYLCTHNIMADY